MCVQLNNNINMVLLEESIDTFSCDLDCAHGVIVCIRLAAENAVNEPLNTFIAELSGIEYHLKLLVGILGKETDNANFTTNAATVLDIQKRLQRLLGLFDSVVFEAPCDTDTVFLHRKAISAAFAAYHLVRSTNERFDKVVG